MQKSTRFPGSSKTKVCILGPTTKSDTPFIDNMVTLEDIRTGIARNRLRGLSFSWLIFDMGVFYIHVLDKQNNYY